MGTLPNMKRKLVFAIAADVSLEYNPDWLDSFRAKYDKPFPYHITLKQPTIASAHQINSVVRILTSLSNSTQIPNHEFRLTFSHISTDAADGSIIIWCKEDRLFSSFQKKLIERLKIYNNFVETAGADWENHFKPHLTIAHDLNALQLQTASQDANATDLPIASVRQYTVLVADTGNWNKPAENVRAYASFSI